MEAGDSRILLTADDLDGYLSVEDKQDIKDLDELYSQAMQDYKILESSANQTRLDQSRENIISTYNRIGDRIQEICDRHPQINVYSFQLPPSSRGEASRLIAKLRDVRTSHQEFLYYIQRAYELLFNLAFHQGETQSKNHLIVKTPVNDPVQNYAIHKIPDVDSKIENSVMCVMLRGALLPSMIMSKEVQEYSSTGYVTPFALFRIQRDDSRKESDMHYVLDLKSSFFDLESLDGKDLFFADPMNATGGSLVTIVQYLKDQGVKPRSIQFFNVISAVKGSLRIARAIEGVKIYTLWMDPVLNSKAYILPGLGDAGDRLNGQDIEGNSRNIIQLIADYGAGITNLYRSQVREIERTVLGEMG
ncbi:uracil phosphoribosyltransferase [Salinispira pacifica]|uniref:Uracil phosphoribosyltransferase n=1 Tax=Salinispira pacifica TaxID=1307761 RepID=V5WFG5_9SPIO|nr:uracil phosphoribosyltransferase [Salinispira pacifica]AHC14537.1 Uracil phosphoribosyltransferase [Salinispira pacifica]